MIDIFYSAKMSDQTKKKRLDCTKCLDKPFRACKVDDSHDAVKLGRCGSDPSQGSAPPASEPGDPGPGSDNPKFKFRHPSTRNELASYYLHFMGPKPFYKTYSYV